MARRLAKELPLLRKKSLRDDGIALDETTGETEIGGDAKGTTSLVAMLAGPLDSPYADGVFKLQFTVTPQYPMEPPKVTFQTKVFHPNIGSGHTPGAICLDILRKEAWSPALTLERVLISIASLLADPNPNSPMNADAANLYMNDRPAYDKKVRDMVSKFASKGKKSGKASSADGGAWLGDFGVEDPEADQTASGAQVTSAAASAGTAVQAKRSAAAVVIDLSDEPQPPAKKSKKKAGKK